MTYDLKAVKAKVKKALPDVEFYQGQDGDIARRGMQQVYMYRRGDVSRNVVAVMLEAEAVIDYFRRFEDKAHE